MNTATIRTRRKNIDIREDVFHFLSIKAAASGTNLKNYIETLLEKDVEDMDETTTYQYLCNTRPDGILPTRLMFRDLILLKRPALK